MGVASFIADQTLEHGHPGSVTWVMWDLPWPGIEPVSFALQGGFLTIGPPGKPPCSLFWLFFVWILSSGGSSWEGLTSYIFQFSSVQSLNRVRLFATPWTAACQASLSITNSTCPQFLPVNIDDAVPLESGPLSIGYRKSGCSIIWWCQVLLLIHFWITLSERRCSRARDRGLFRQLTVEGPPHHCSYHSYREFSFRWKEQDLNINVNTYFFFFHKIEDNAYNEKLSKTGLPWWYSELEYTCCCRGHGFDPWYEKIPHAVGQPAWEPQLLSPHT